jgi:hypothetical protein
MKEQRNNDVYNHPQSEDEINQKVKLNNTEGQKAEQKIAVNPTLRRMKILSIKIFQPKILEPGPAVK